MMINSNFQNSLLFVFIFISSFGFAQDITVDKGTWGYEFKQGEEQLSWKELLEETQAIPESYDLIKRAQSQNIVSTIFGLAGGAFIGIPLGQAISNADPNWVLAIVGGALLTVAIPLSSSSKRNLNNGISTYNSRNNTSFLESFPAEVNVIGNANGVGLQMRF